MHCVIMQMRLVINVSLCSIREINLMSLMAYVVLYLTSTINDIVIMFFLYNLTYDLLLEPSVGLRTMS